MHAGSSGKSALAGVRRRNIGDVQIAQRRAAATLHELKEPLLTLRGEVGRLPRARGENRDDQSSARKTPSRIGGAGWVIEIATDSTDSIELKIDTCKLRR
jgi:hypothetical protein